MNFNESKMVFTELYLQWILLGIMFLAVVVLFLYFYGWYRQIKQLEVFRESLSRGDYVMVEGFGEQMVWTNHLDGNLTIRVGMPESGYCYRRVSVQDVYPAPDKPEYEIIS